MNIRIINQLALNKNGVCAKYSNGKTFDFFVRQGDLDGACAPYCVLMILQLLRVIKREDIALHNAPDRRTSIGKLLNKFLAEKGLVTEGYDYKSLFNELQVLKNSIQTEYVKTFTDQSFIQFQDEIDNNNPVLISLQFKEGAHAVVMVGYESDDKSNLTKILCLDPGFPKPENTYWNSVIEVSKFNCNYSWLTSNCEVDFDDYITFNKLK